MRPPLARLSRAGLAAFAAACLTASFAPPSAFASHYVVDQNGGGDFTTIQAALDALPDLSRGECQSRRAPSNLTCQPAWLRPSRGVPSWEPVLPALLTASGGIGAPKKRPSAFAAA